MLEDVAYLSQNFLRKKCKKCGSYYWTRDQERDKCGDAPCVQYSFIEKPVLERKNLSEMREFFLSFFEKRKHKRIEPYPVIARWRDDVLLTNASIYDFQPWVTSGKVPPPANPLVISQPCIRMDDLESVGRSGRHLTAFEMLAHHAFNKKEEKIYWKDETIRYCDELLSELRANLEEVTYKEKFWYGGGNAGPSVEVLLGGLELATLVFMDMELSPDGKMEIGGEKYEKMDRWIVDTGYGLERFTWASLGTPTIYEAVFPQVVEILAEEASMEISDRQILAANAKVAGMLGDVKGENLPILRKKVASTLGIPERELLKIIEPMETIYAICDHTRCLAWMLRDGMVPSNVKEGYLARLLVRRTLRLLSSLGIKKSLSEIVSLHLKDRWNKRIGEILDLEEEKYRITLKRGKGLVARTLQKYKKEGRGIPLDEIIKFYDTHGIPPEITKEVADEYGASVSIPYDFYSLIAKKHEKIVREKERRKLDVRTEKIYYENPSLSRFEARVISIQKDGIILDRTAFYPEGGGQEADDGWLILDEERIRVEWVKEMDGAILHKVANPGIFRVGDRVRGEVNMERRTALSSHHTATHLVLEAAKRVLGEHIWQSGAEKSVESARLDLSHYKRISSDELQKIEMIANELVMENIDVRCFWVARNEAEKKWGFTLYQGGIPPGERIRIVEAGSNVQACGGTHCETTGKIGVIKMIRSERIQDGIERIEFCSGKSAIKWIQSNFAILESASKILRVPSEKIPSAAERFFREWKELRKESTKLKESLAILRTRELLRKKRKVGKFWVVSSILDADKEELIKIGMELSKHGIVSLLVSKRRGEAEVVVASPGKPDARKIITAVCRELGGGGGGKKELAHGGGPKVGRIQSALKKGLLILK